MSSQDFSGISDLGVMGVFMDFPVPLALLRPEGKVEFINARFDQLFGVGCLESDELRDVARHPGRPWQAVQLLGRDGGLVAAQAQAVRVSERIIIAIEDTPGQVYAAELEQLRARILELERLSSSDHLTGAWNRAHLDRTIESELARCIRYKQPLSLVLIDVDHFKRINDTYGHQSGDTVLRELVQTIRATIRTADLLFRWGGEEFVVLASATGYRAAERLAEKLRHSIEEHVFPDVGILTISLGVAEHSGAESAEAWFRRLDEALYAAKTNGRNRVAVDRCGNSDEWAAGSGVSVLRLVWQEAYECGQPTIDGQHRELFDLANALIDASFKTNAFQAGFECALDRLLAHIVQHFADEEALLAEHRYARLEAHKNAHAKLLARATELRSQADNGVLQLGSLVEFLANDVITRHLFKVDQDFYPLFAAGHTAGEGHVQ
jgi:diguanylate cyclase (GGDEF)-like protein/hemerythrin-like metal-binding protein